MGETSLFVPIIESRKNEETNKYEACQSLYYVKTLDTSPDSRWYICGTPDTLITNKIEKGLESFSIDISQPIKFPVYRYDNNKNPIPLKEDEKESSENTQSMCLGLFIAAYRHLRHLSFKDTWDSITITGDLDPHDNKVDLKEVGDIENKFKAAQDYASKHKGKHLFLYISNKNEIEPDIYDNNLVVKVFPEKYHVGAVIAEILEPCFNEEQKQLFGKCNESLPFDKDNVDLQWKYISTWAFEEMKQEALLSEWKGFLIHGQGESGKSAMTFEFARYLAATEKIYAPIWVRIENEKLQQNIEKPKLISNPFENQNPLIDNPIAAYIAKLIVKTLDSDAGSDLSRLAKLIDRGNAPPYLLVIDNLELNSVIEVINAVQIILGAVKNKPPFIITSRFDEKELGYAQRIGLKNKPQDKAALSYDEVESLVGAVSRGQEYEEKLVDKNNKEYQNFISSLYSHFDSFPGVITQIVPLLADRTLSEINPLLLSMKDMKFQEKINAVYQVIFSQLDDFTQAVFFSFINTIAVETLDKSINDIPADPQKIAEQIYDFEWTLPDGTSLTLSEIQEEIPNTLIELARSHLIYKTTHNSSSDKTEFFIKTLPYISFMFEGSLEGNMSNGESLRDILLFLPAVISEGLRYNQSVSRLRKYLEKLKNEDEDYLSYVFLCVAAIVSDRPEHIDLLHEFGYDINQKWERESFRNPLQCAAIYNNNPSILQRLIDKDADYKSADEFGCTPLHLAAKNNSSPEVIAILIKKLDMYTTDNNKKTPLEYAAQNPHKAIIEMFYNKGAEIKKVFSGNMTLLHHAAANKNPEIAEWLIKKGLDIHIHAAEKNGWTPLHCSLFRDNNTEMINLLLEHGAISDINKKVFDINPPWYRKNYTLVLPPLHLAAFINKTSDNIDLLVEKGAEINFKDREGSTPLHIAATFNEDPDMITFLLNHHANINEKDSKGRTPVYWAASNKNSQVAIALIKAGAKLDDEVKYKSIFYLYGKIKVTALKRLKKRKDWPDIKAAILSSVPNQNI